EAESKFFLAIRQCIEALQTNAKDAKIFNALSKANLRKGILLFRIKQDKKAIDSLKAVSKSSSQSFKQGLYKLESFVVLGEYYLSVQNTDEIKKILRSIEMEFKSSPILRKNNLTDRITDLTEYISPEK